MHRPCLVWSGILPAMRDDLEALERGDIAPPAVASDVLVRRSAAVARDWARSLGLRQGNTRGPTSAALVPVVAAWAAGHGLTGPGHRDIGRGLMWVGLKRRVANRQQQLHLVLHREDAARLWAMVRAAGAPA